MLAFIRLIPVSFNLKEIVAANSDNPFGNNQPLLKVVDFLGFCQTIFKEIFLSLNPSFLTKTAAEFVCLTRALILQHKIIIQRKK
jgi:hypothetical protein